VEKLNLKNAELVLCGTLHGEMKPFYNELGTDSVKHLGHIPNVPQELARSSAFIFPSECEGFAKATVEAAACGLPLITTREGGDMVIDGHNGFVVPANDADALADAIQLAYDKHSELQQMGLRGLRARGELPDLGSLPAAAAACVCSCKEDKEPLTDTN